VRHFTCVVWCAAQHVCRLGERPIRGSGILGDHRGAAPETRAPRDGSRQPAHGIDPSLLSEPDRAQHESESELRSVAHRERPRARSTIKAHIAQHAAACPSHFPRGQRRGPTVDALAHEWSQAASTQTRGDQPRTAVVPAGWRAVREWRACVASLVSSDDRRVRVHRAARVCLQHARSPSRHQAPDRTTLCHASVAQQTRAIECGPDHGFAPLAARHLGAQTSVAVLSQHQSVPSHELGKNDHGILL
jgi:hypothetical protein